MRVRARVEAQVEGRANKTSSECSLVLSNNADGRIEYSVLPSVISFFFLSPLIKSGQSKVTAAAAAATEHDSTTGLLVCVCCSFCSNNSRSKKAKK